MNIISEVEGMKLFIEFDEKGKTAKKHGRIKKSSGKSSSASGRKWLPYKEWKKQKSAKQQEVE